MTRWDPEPTFTERWLVRHRTPSVWLRPSLSRVVAVLSIVFAIGQIVYVLATAGELGWSLGGSRPLITSPCLFLVLTRSASSHVEKYDNARHQGPNSK
jgi:hypothetical protein